MSNQNQEQYQFIEEILSAHVSNAGKIQEFEFFYGGNFNLAGRIKIDLGEYFIKWNQGEHKGLLESEAKNLKLLASTSTVSVPSVLAFGIQQEKEFLIMECVHSIEKSNNFNSDLGEKIAKLHQNTHANGFGLAYDNFIGLSHQPNEWNTNGVDFFIQNRLLFQIEKALYDRKIDKKLAEKFENFFKELPSIFPQEKSSLIHGDLWTGNVMVNESGLATLVDPTCYYGFREADIAFSTMFGGFEEEFYKTYNEHFPLEKGFHARIPYYNLYPLLVHVNLFGEGYIPTIETILKPF